MTQENTARNEDAAAEKRARKDVMEARVDSLAQMLIRVCEDEKDQSVRVSALADALAIAIVEHAHDKKGQLVLEDVLGIRDGVMEHIAQVSVVRHTLNRIARDPSTVARGDSDRDDMKDLLSALAPKRGKEGAPSATVTRMPPAVAAALLASLLGRGKED